MTSNKAIDWCNSLTRAWKEVDFNAILEIFSDVEAYYEDPFAEPGSTPEEILKFWDEIRYQKINRLNLIPMAIDGNTVVIRWYLDYTDLRTNDHYAMDGVYHVVFNDKNKCVRFTQWWVIKE